MAPVIETYNLTKVFSAAQGWRRYLHPSDASRETVIAVDRVNLSVNEGELFGLLGPNGAGKTTLVKMLCTLIWPTDGRAQVGGFDLSDDMSIRRVIGLAVSDERSFYWRLSGRQNLAFYAALHDIPVSKRSARIEEVLAWMGMTEKADQRFSNYSSGQKQRLAIARAVLHRPRILFMDEPTRSLDPKTAEQIHHFILEELVGREGMTLFLTTHRLDEAQKLCDRVAIMHQGRIQACGALDELRGALQPHTRYRLLLRGLAAEARSAVPFQLGTILSADGSDDVWLEVETVREEDALAEAIQWASHAGARVRRVEEKRLTLEEVFDRFTES